MGLNKRLLDVQSGPTPQDGGDYFRIGTYTGQNQAQFTINTVIDIDILIIQHRDLSNSVKYMTQSAPTRTSWDLPGTAGYSQGNGINVWGSTSVDTYQLATMNSSGRVYIWFGWKTGQDAGVVSVSYEGNNTAKTISHGLGDVPEMIWVRHEEYGSGGTIVYHKDMDSSSPQNYYIDMTGSTSARQSDSTVWNNTAPTSSVFSVGTSNFTNYGSRTHFAHLFKSVEGLSKIGSFTGDAPNDVSVECGFEPQFIWLKDATNTNETIVFNNVQGGGVYQQWNSETRVTTSEGVTFDSTGFTVGNNSNINTSGAKMLFYAIAKDL